MLLDLFRRQGSQPNKHLGRTLFGQVVNLAHQMLIRWFGKRPSTTRFVGGTLVCLAQQFGFIQTSANVDPIHPAPGDSITGPIPGFREQSLGLCHSLILSRGMDQEASRGHHSQKGEGESPDPGRTVHVGLDHHWIISF